MIDHQDVDRFYALFRGNERSYGVYLPQAKTKMMTIKGKPHTHEDVRAHLEGERGLGIVPIMDDARCWFAAIDIDVHGPNGQHVDLQQIDERIVRNQLPLVACRSKSGGAHCYVFFKEPADAGRVRFMLERFAGVLGYPTSEIFPKQAVLKKNDGDAELPLGNWINLPYFDSNETERYAVDGGKQVTLEYFLEMAIQRSVNIDEADRGLEVDYAAGPPCLQSMIENKLDEGSRNTAAFQAAIFLKRAHNADWRQRLNAFNQMAFITPLTTQEMRTIIGSVGKKDYQYKCRDEPCKSLCQKALCKKRPFGITDNDDKANEIPIFEKVEKIIATPIRWALTVQGRVIEVTTQELFNYEVVRQRISESHHMILPRIKANEWDHFLRDMMTKVETRVETTVEDILFMRLCEYLKRTRTDKDRSENDRRNDLRRGAPTLISINTVTFDSGQLADTPQAERQWLYAFKMSDFIDYMRRKKAIPCADHQVPTLLNRVLGMKAKKDKLRVPGEQAAIGNVWCVEETIIENEAIPTLPSVSEF